MSQGPRHTLAQVKNVVEQIRPLLDQATERYKFAGSYRRRRPTVGDLEIIVIERFMCIDLASLMQQELIVEELRDCPKTIFATIAPLHLKIEICKVTPATWPVMMAIKTGPAWLSKAIVTQRCEGGRLLDGYRIHKGRLLDKQTEAAIELDNEMDFLDRFAGGWLAPKDRDKPPTRR